MVKRREHWDLVERRRVLRERRRALLAYLDVQRAAEDWHGVADAACDIRVVEAQLAEAK